MGAGLGNPRGVFRFGAMVLLMVAIPATAAAHLGSRKYLRAELGEGAVTLRVEVEALDASMELGLGEDLQREAILARGALVRRWLQEGIVIRAGEERCAVEGTAPRWRERDGTPFLELTLTYECGPGPLVLRDETVFPDDPQHEALVHVAWAGGDQALVLRRGRQEATLGVAPSLGAVIGIFLWEGVLHFATGYDHVLFLLSLVLAAGFVSRRRGLRAALRDVALVVTAFTLGHSVTLIAAALQLVVLPARPVEVAIAASIVVVALLNVWRPERRGPLPWIAGGFGLIHGFGFSSVLAELGLPPGRAVTALLSFNVGIELGQLAFVAVALGPLAWAARFEGYGRFVRTSSVIIAALALVWVMQRL